MPTHRAKTHKTSPALLAAMQAGEVRRTPDGAIMHNDRQIGTIGQPVEVLNQSMPDVPTNAAGTPLVGFGHERMGPRGALERRIVYGLLKHLHAAGEGIPAVDDGEVTIAYDTMREVLEAVFAVDDCVLRYPSGVVQIILGNGIDCISDWSVRLPVDAFDVETCL